MTKRNKKDIYDKIVEVRALRHLTMLKKYKEPILYIFFGGLSFVVSICSYAISYYLLSINELVSNVISWVLAVSFAYLTNRSCVFKSTNRDFSGFVKELGKFLAARVGTLIIEEAIIFVFITILCFNSLLIKTVAQIVVIVSNYFLSRIWIFKK